jgi:hypothetical protein
LTPIAKKQQATNKKVFLGGKKMNSNLIMAAISSHLEGVLKVITEDEREHYVTKESYSKERNRAKDGDMLLKNCSIVHVNWKINQTK